MSINPDKDAEDNKPQAYEGGFTTDFLSGINIEEVQQATETNMKDRAVSVKEVREVLTSLTDMIYKQTDQIEYQGYMAVERQLPKEVFHQAKTFFVPDFEYNHTIFGNHLRQPGLGLVNDNGSPTFAGRFVYPVLGFNNEVLGFIGYDKHHTTKYLLSRTTGFGKSSMFYGMHMMRWIYSMGYIVPVEGIVECLYLWTKGIPAISLNGNSLTPFTERVLKRFGYNCILIPDNDETGEMAIKYWKSKLPEASVIKLTAGKDTDDWRKVRDHQILVDAIKEVRESAEIKMPKTVLI